MRILQLAARMLSLERFALPLMQRLRDEGYDCEAMGQFDGSEAEMRAAQFAVHDWRAGHSLNPVRMIAARRQLADLLRFRNYDVIHSHCSFGGILGNSVARRHTDHLLYTQHGFFVHEGLHPVARALWLSIEKRGLAPADRVICVSQAEREMAENLGVGPPEKFVLVPGAGVDLSAFQLPSDLRAERRGEVRRELAIDDDELVLLTVSRLTWDKGYREMIDAVARLRGEGHAFTMLAAGSGKNEAGIRRAIARAGMEDSFRLLGWRDDVADLYAAADIFVFASHREGLPISPIEAMASGLPVVVSDIPGNREEVEEGRSGVLFSTGDADELAERLAALVADEDLRVTLAAGAQERATLFGLEEVLDRQVQLYREIAGS